MPPPIISAARTLTTVARAPPAAMKSGWISFELIDHEELTLTIKTSSVASIL
jgi:hypothetical protein